MSSSEPDDLPVADGPAKPRHGWRGSQPSTGTAASPTPAWRSTPAELPSRLIDRQRQRRSVITVVLFLLATALFGILVRDLVFYPRMVPFVALCVTDYAQPLPPNGWAREDLDQFLDPNTGLQEKTLVIEDLSLELRSLDRARRSLAAALSRSRNNAVHSGTLIVYISMHGFVNDQNQVALLLPDSDPVNSRTWWPLQEVFHAIKDQNLPADALKLVILDCNRSLTYLPAGVACNNLASCLEEEVARSGLENLAILNSTSPGEMGWQSRDMHGSVFAQFLRVGLAGAADRQSHGNHNRKISLHELHDFLVDSVDRWAWTHRRSRQRPMLVPAAIPNRMLTWTLGRTEVESIIAEAETQATPVPSVAIDVVSRLWFDFHALQKADRFRTNPMKKAEIEHQLLWLETALIAGGDYAEPALEAQRQLEETLVLLQQQPPGAARIFQEVTAGTGDSTPGGLPGVSFDSLPLGMLFQGLGTNTSSMVQSELQQVCATPSLQAIQAAIQTLSADPQAVTLAEFQFLKLLAQYIPGLNSSSLEQLADLIRLHVLAEQVAAPADERIMTWMLPLLDAAERDRRIALDTWLSGQPATAAIVTASRRYDAVQRLSSDLTRALALRDDVASELPYLIHWISRPTWPARKAADQIRLIQDVLPRLLDAQRNLNAALEQRVSTDDVASLMESSPFQAQMDDLSDNYNALRSLIDNEYERLLQPSDDEALRLVEIIELMHLPLLPRKDSLNGLAPFAQRTSLQEWGLQASTDLQAHIPPFAVPPPDARPLENPVDREALIRQWSPHPFVGMLGNVKTGLPPAPANSPDPLTAAARQMRQALTAVPGQLDATEREAHGMQGDPHPLLVQNDWLLRTFAGLLIHTPVVKPSGELQQYDLRMLILNAAARRLDDFWGSAQSTNNPFFATAAESDLAFARLLMEPGPFAQSQFAQLRQTLNNRQLASADGLQISASDVLLLESLPAIPETMRIDPAPGLPATAFPAGTGTALLRPVGSQVPVVNQPLPLPLKPADDKNGTTEIGFQLTPGEVANTALQWDAVVSYRGHEFPAAFLAHLPQGSVTDFQPAHPQTASLMISGGPVRRESIVFILDCSHSMSEKSAIESPGEPPTRIAAASAALQSMLTRLATRKDVQVGVQFFGHRVGWNTKQPGQMLPQVGYGRPIPPGLQPYEDVEVILPLGRFDPSWELSVANLLKTVKPWGESPIYLSIIRALPLFLTQDLQETQTIVVITDGINYQFNPAFGSRKDLQDVVTAVQGKGIAVHIVGFGITDKDAPTAQQEFGTLARLTNGSYTPVDKASQLVDSLEKILSVQDFTVLADQQSAASSEVGKPVTINGPFPPTRQVTATLGPASLKLPISGGEAVELSPTADGTELRSVRYERNLTTLLPLVNGTPTVSLELGVHQALRRENGAMFEFSLQDRQRRFVPRPAGIWLTITPGDGTDASVQPYIFYDPEFVPNTPVPVVQWLANDFPAKQKQAQVQVWVRNELPELIGEYSLKQNLVTAIRDGATLSLPSLPDIGVDIRVRPGDIDRIDVVERHPAGVTARDLLYVTLQTDRAIQRVVRRFDLAQQVVVHMFLLANDQRAVADRLGNTRVQVRTHRAFAAGAFHLTEPALVEITTDPGLIRPTLLPPDTP